MIEFIFNIWYIDWGYFWYRKKYRTLHTYICIHPIILQKKKKSNATLSNFLLRAHLIMILVKTSLTYSVFIYNNSMRNVFIRIDRSDHNSVFLNIYQIRVKGLLILINYENEKKIIKILNKPIIFNYIMYHYKPFTISFIVTNFVLNLHKENH